MTRLTELAPRLLVATSRTYSLNSVVVVGQDAAALVIDPGWPTDELEDLATEVAERGLQPAAGFATHAHHDHLLWHPALGDVPRWASPDTVRLAGSHRAGILEALGPGFENDVLDLVGRVSALPGLDVPWPGPETDAVIHDAHVEGHSALWIAELGVLVAGDMLSDLELPLPGDEPGALATYRAGLETLEPYACAARFVIPGHGSFTTDGASRVAADLRYLDDLEAGRESTDIRLSHPDMPGVHAANRALLGP